MISKESYSKKSMAPFYEETSLSWRLSLFAKELNDKEKDQPCTVYSAYEQELLETSDEELNNESKLFGRLFRRIF